MCLWSCMRRTATMGQEAATEPLGLRWHKERIPRVDRLSYSGGSWITTFAGRKNIGTT